MPIFEFHCAECGATSEVLIASSDDEPTCRSCGSANLTKLLSTPSCPCPGPPNGASRTRRHLLLRRLAHPMRAAPVPQLAAENIRFDPCRRASRQNRSLVRVLILTVIEAIGPEGCGPHG